MLTFLALSHKKPNILGMVMTATRRHFKYIFLYYLEYFSPNVPYVYYYHISVNLPSSIVNDMPINKTDITRIDF